MLLYYMFHGSGGAMPRAARQPAVLLRSGGRAAEMIYARCTRQRAKRASAQRWRTFCMPRTASGAKEPLIRHYIEWRRAARYWYVDENAVTKQKSQTRPFGLRAPLRRRSTVYLLFATPPQQLLTPRYGRCHYDVMKVQKAKTSKSVLSCLPLF